MSGKVQGVSFRRYTKGKADEFGLVVWCRNTPRGTVEGEYEYEVVSVEEKQQSSPASAGEEENQRTGEAAFRHWLCNVASPRSSIDGCTFSEKVTSNSHNFNEFRVADKYL